MASVITKNKQTNKQISLNVWLLVLNSLQSVEKKKINFSNYENKQISLNIWFLVLDSLQVVKNFNNYEKQTNNNNNNNNNNNIFIFHTVIHEHRCKAKCPRLNIIFLLLFPLNPHGVIIQFWRTKLFSLHV